MNFCIKKYKAQLQWLLDCYTIWILSRPSIGSSSWSLPPWLDHLPALQEVGWYWGNISRWVHIQARRSIYMQEYTWESVHCTESLKIFLVYSKSLLTMRKCFNCFSSESKIHDSLPGESTSRKLLYCNTLHFIVYNILIKYSHKGWTVYLSVVLCC